jgi:hypothetical protein
MYEFHEQTEMKIWKTLNNYENKSFFLLEKFS